MFNLHKAGTDLKDYSDKKDNQNYVLKIMLADGSEKLTLGIAAAVPVTMQHCGLLPAICNGWPDKSKSDSQLVFSVLLETMYHCELSGNLQILNFIIFCQDVLSTSHLHLSQIMHFTG